MLLIALVAGIFALLIAYVVLRPRGRPAPTPFPDTPVRTITIGDDEIRYHQSGQGPPVVLIHGLGANLFCWRQIIPLLAKKYTVTALDLPGFGGSTKSKDAGYGLDEQVQRLHRFFRRLGIHNSYLVGNSMGGNLALWYALNYPDEVLGAAVIAPATSPALVPLAPRRWLWLSHPVSFLLSRQAMRWAHRRTVTRKNLVDHDRVEETFRTYGRNGEAVRSFLKAIETIRDPRLGQRLGELQIPTLVLWGSEDLVVSRPVIDELIKKIPHAQSEIHLGGGHHLQEDEPVWVAEKLDAHFANHRT